MWERRLCMYAVGGFNIGCQRPLSIKPHCQPIPFKPCVVTQQYSEGAACPCLCPLCKLTRSRKAHSDCQISCLSKKSVGRNRHLIINGPWSSNILWPGARHGNVRLAKFSFIRMYGYNHRMHMHSDKRPAYIYSGAGPSP